MSNRDDDELDRVIRVHELTDRARASTEVESLRADVARLSLLCQTMWEMMQHRLNVSEAELLALMDEIDLRDGKKDGQITRHAVRCPKCHRVCSSHQKRCLYCGLDFQQSIAP